MSYNDWEQRKEETEDDSTERSIAYHRELVEQYLQENGLKGYAIGEGYGYLMRIFHICVLDPYEEKPKDILVFVDKLSSFQSDLSVSPAEKEKYTLKNTEDGMQIDIQKDEKSNFFVKTDPLGNIISIRD
ncbi:hypothetical protein GYA44_03125 [Candidatus Microgenomates bacterium]|nr:hypothetical protein [Candidatus Microgenomates bacterium]